MGLKQWQHKKKEKFASSKNIKFSPITPLVEVTLLEEGAEFLISKGVVFAKEHSLTTKSIPPPWFCKIKKSMVRNFLLLSFLCIPFKVLLGYSSVLGYNAIHKM